MSLFPFRSIPNFCPLAVTGRHFIPFRLPLTAKGQKRTSVIVPPSPPDGRKLSDVAPALPRVPAKPRPQSFSGGLGRPHLRISAQVKQREGEGQHMARRAGLLGAQLGPQILHWEFSRVKVLRVDCA